MNTVANSVGVSRGKPEGLLGRLLRDYAQRANAPLENVERHVMRIGPRDGAPRDRTHYGFLFGTGVVYGFLAEYYRGGEPTPLVAAKTLARGIGSAFIGGRDHPAHGAAVPRLGLARRRQPGGLRWDERDYLAVAAGTIDHIGLNFKPFHRYAERPGAFHMLGIHASPDRLREGAAAHPQGRAHAAGQGVRRRVDAAPSSGAPTGSMRYMIDGDLHETRGEIELGIGPRVKLVIVR